jgi:hypothetical protein
MPSWSMMRRIGVGVLAVALSFAATAKAAPTWLPPKALSGASGVPLDNDVAGDAAGGALMLWNQPVAADDRVHAMFRPAAGSFGTPRVLSNPGANATPPRVAMNARGDGFAAWCRNGRAELAARPFGQLFLGEQDLGPCTSSTAGPIDVAARADGSALVAWTGPVGGCDVVQVRERLPNGTLTMTRNLSTCPAANSITPRVAQNGRGDAAVLFVRGNVAMLATRVGTALFGPADQVSAGPDSDPSVAISESGHVTAVWRNLTTIQATRHPVGTAFDDGTAISDNSVTSPPDVALDAGGIAVAAWVDGGGILRTATAPGTGDFGVPAPVPGSTGASQDPSDHADVEFSSNGSAMVLFIRAAGTGQAAYAAVRPPGQGFQPAARVSRENQRASRPHLAMDRQGNATALWSNRAMPAAGDYLLDAAGYDAGAPGFGAIVTPASGMVGQALTFAAPAFDVWTGVSVGWSFGDGTGAAGMSSSHAYQAPGTYTIGITASDAVGNATGTSRTVVIHAPPPDSDGDGYPDDLDCDDANKAIHPGAKEIRGNRRDENCDHKSDPYLQNPAVVSVSWSVDGRRLTVTRFRVKQVPKGGRATVRCTGKRCPFARKRVGKPRRGTINVFKTLKTKRQRRLLAGQMLEVRVTAPEHFGKVVRYPLKAGDVPSSQTYCVWPGERRLRRRC